MLRLLNADTPTMTAVVFRVGRNPDVEPVPEPLEGMQAFVGGYIAPLFLNTPVGRLCLLCDEEAPQKGKPPSWNVENRIIHGDFFIVQEVGSNFVSLTPEQIAFVVQTAANRWGQLAS